MIFATDINLGMHTIGGGAGEGAGGVQPPPPNDGVVGTMHSGPPNSDTSGPYVLLKDLSQPCAG